MVTARWRSPISAALFRCPISLIFPSFSTPQTGAFIFYCCSLNSEVFVGANGINRQRQFNTVDNLNVVKGAHQLKFGVDHRNLSPTFGRRAYDQEFLYLTAASLVNNAASEAFVDNASGASGLEVVTNNFSVFAQDAWRAGRRLTLTYGLRWEYNPAPHVSNRPAPWVVDQVSNIATTQLVSSGAPLWHASAANFAPRLGVAYQLSDSREMGHGTARGRRCILRHRLRPARRRVREQLPILWL